MVLLTSGTISAAISSGIVFLCTTALFLSGYVLQQKSINSLREQIREPARPQHTLVYLPHQFADNPSTPDGEGTPDMKVEMPTEPVVLEKGPGVVEGNGRGELELTEEVLRSGRVIAMEVGRQIPMGRDEGGIGGGEGGEGAGEGEKDEWEGMSRAERRRKIKEDIEEATRKDREGYHRRTY